MPLIPTAPVKRPSEAGDDRPSKKQRRDRDHEPVPTLIPTAAASVPFDGVVPIGPQSDNTDPQTITPASVPTLQLPFPTTTAPVPAKRRTHNRLPPPKPQPNYPVHLSTTNPLREQKGIGRARDVIYVTAQTSMGAYLSRCKSLLVDQGINKIILHALAASIPHAMILLHALLDVLPYPEQYVRYELRTSTVECVDEMLVEVDSRETLRSGKGKGKAKRTAKLDIATGKGQKGEADGAEQRINAEAGPSRIKGANTEPARPTLDIADVEDKTDELEDQDILASGGDQEADNDVDEELLKMMMQDVEGGAGGEVSDAGFRVRSKSALEIIMRIGKPPHNGPSRPPKPPPTTTSSMSTRYTNGEALNPPTDGESMSIDKSPSPRARADEKRNRPSKAGRARLQAKEKARRAGEVNAGTRDRMEGGTGSRSAVDREEEEAMMNAA